MNRLALASALLLARAATALAQSDPPAPVAAPPADYRWAIYTSCTVVFAAIVAYLAVTHSRAASVASEVDAIERRLDELESREAK